MLSYLPEITLLRSGELRFCLGPQSPLCSCYSVTGSPVLGALEVLYLLGMGFINGHLVGFRFLSLVRIKSSQKWILLKLCLPLVRVRKSSLEQLRAA